MRVGQPKLSLEYLDPFGGLEARLEGGCRSVAQGQPLPTGRQAESLGCAQGALGMSKDMPRHLCSGVEGLTIYKVCIYTYSKEVRR